ncbi:MAG: hypothetical protein QM622_06880 [Microbacterium sp.]
MTCPPPVTPRVILPPGWHYLPVSSDNAGTVERALAPMRTLGPRDSIAPFAKELERALQRELDDAFRAGAFAVAMPLGRPWEVPVSTSIAFSRLTVPNGSAALPAVGETVQTDAGIARRRIVDAPVAEDTAPAALALLRTIDYTWVVDGAYVIAVASISGEADPEFAPVAEALTLLITTMLDAVTFAATRQEATP